MKRILCHNIYRSAEKFPERVAFKQLKKAISYEQLVSKSNCIANFLIKLGVKKGDRVGIFMNRSLESSFAVYGILAAGAVYVPIDTKSPVKRILGLIQDCGIDVLITLPQHRKKVIELTESRASLNHIIGVDESISDNVQTHSWEEIMSYNDKAPPVALSEDDNAYIIYTSGTTGNPKGIIHTNYSGFSYAKLSAELYGLDEHDVLGNHSHLHYDISTMGYLTVPFVGASTVIVPEAHTIFPFSLGQLIEEEKISIWYSVPLAIIQLLISDALMNRNLENLRWILFGGEIFPVKYIHQLLDLVPKVNFSNVYGPAEVNQCTFYNFDINNVPKKIIPLGKAWPETELAIESPEESQRNKTGELLVHSSTQMRGYWNQEELTKSKLIKLSAENGLDKYYYKTGDVVSLMENGEYVFIGRTDRQVKIKGHRVELNEIAGFLLKHEAIQDVAVYAKKEGDINVVYASLVLDKNDDQTIDFRKYLSDFLPDYALPEKIKFTEEIPRTGAGKVDYKLLKR